MIRELRIRLAKAAGNKDEFVHYDEVADILGISRDRLDHSHKMNHALEEISTYEHDNRRPMLTAVVVRKNELTPGKGFFDLASRIGKLRPGQDRDEFYFRELANVRKYWKKHAPGTECPVSRGPAKGGQASVSSPHARSPVIFSTSGEPKCNSGHHVTEKFRVPDNAYLCCRARKRRTRLIPLRIFRSASFEAVLRDASTDKVAKDAMKEGRGKLRLRGRSTIFGGKTVEGEMIIQNGGEYYMEIKWGALIVSWEVSVKT